VINLACPFAFMAVTCHTEQILLESLGKFAQVMPAAGEVSKHAPFREAFEGAASEPQCST
jgi:hypothetical protein